jgi:hypothetical protein
MEGPFPRRILPLDDVCDEADDCSRHSPGRAWRCGAMLVAEHGALLPTRCVRCNRPVESPAVHCPLFLAPNKWWLPTVLGVIPWYLARAATGRRSFVRAHFCEIHLGRQRAAIRIAGLLWATGALMILLAFIRHGLDAFAGVIAILAGLMVWLLSPGSLSATRIDDEHVWIEGVDRAFLAELPARSGDFSLN